MVNYSVTGNETSMPAITTPFNILLEVLANVIRE